MVVYSLNFLNRTDSGCAFSFCVVWENIHAPHKEDFVIRTNIHPSENGHLTPYFSSQCLALNSLSPLGIVIDLYLCVGVLSFLEQHHFIITKYFSKL